MKQIYVVQIVAGTLGLIAGFIALRRSLRRLVVASSPEAAAESV